MKLCLKCKHSDTTLDAGGKCNALIVVEGGHADVCGCTCQYVLTSERNDTVAEVIDQRIAIYGEPVEMFARAAEIWSGIIGHHINPTDVPLMLIGYKVLRTQHTPDYSDNSDDIEGYLDIFRKLVGEDMVHARSVTEYVELKGRR